MAKRKRNRFYILSVLLLLLFPCRVLLAAELSPELQQPPIPETSNLTQQNPPDNSFPDGSLTDANPLSPANLASPGSNPLPDVTPPAGGITGPMWTLQPDYTLNVSFSDESGSAVWMRYTTDNQSWQWHGWQAYSNTMDIHEDYPLGTNLRIWVQACDASWNCSSAETTVHYGSMMAPEGSITGPMFTLNGPVDISVDFRDRDTAPVKMRYSTNFRETSDITWSNFIDYNSVYQINESRPLGSNLPILVQVCDESWNCSSAETSVHFGSINAPRGYINYPDMYAPSGGGNITLNVDFHDYDSSAMVMRYSTNVATGNPTWSSFENYASTISIPASGPDGTSERVWVQVCDESWNCDSAETTIFFGLPPFLNPLL